MFLSFPLIPNVEGSVGFCVVEAVLVCVFFFSENKIYTVEYMLLDKGHFT